MGQINGIEDFLSMTGLLEWHKAKNKPRRVTKHVEEHETEQLVCPEGGWTFTRVKTGCIRVQKGDFTAYVLEQEAEALADFIRDTARSD